jgi:hypothetical protein
MGAAVAAQCKAIPVLRKEGEQDAPRITGGFGPKDVCVVHRPYLSGVEPFSVSSSVLALGRSWPRIVKSLPGDHGWREHVVLPL